MSGSREGSSSPVINPSVPIMESSSHPSHHHGPHDSNQATTIHVGTEQDGLILPEDISNPATVELIREFIHPSHHQLEGSPDFEELVAETSESEAVQIKLPWWKRSSPWWILACIPFTTLAMTSTAAPKVELCTRLVCELRKPDFTTIIRLDERQQNCAADPVVQAEVAMLIMVISTIAGILGSITAGYWGSYSDRAGRTRVIASAAFGLVVSDINFLFVSNFFKVIPGGYWLLLLGGIFEGILGSFSAGNAAISAYISDCTDATSRSRYYTLYIGFASVGGALGPTLGGLIVHYTGAPLGVFYFACMIHSVYLLFVLLIVPQSLSKDQMWEARKRRDEELEEYAQSAYRSPFISLAYSIFGFLTPIKVLFSLNEDDGEESHSLKPRKDSNLLLAALGIGFTSIVSASTANRFQYMSATFGWNSEQLGYWLTMYSLTTAVYMAVILPAIIKILQPKSQPIELPTEDAQPLNPEAGSPPANSSTIESEQKSKKQIQALKFDLGLARFSVFMLIISFSTMPLATRPWPFVGFSLIACLGYGFGPALQSVILGLYTLRGGKETGKLFGAVAVVESLCVQILGPGLFGFVYVQTVGTFSGAVFFLGAMLVMVSFVLLLFIRIRKSSN